MSPIVCLYLCSWTHAVGIGEADSRPIEVRYIGITDAYMRSILTYVRSERDREGRGIYLGLFFSLLSCVIVMVRVSCRRALRFGRSSIDGRSVKRSSEGADGGVSQFTMKASYYRSPINSAIDLDMHSSR